MTRVALNACFAKYDWALSLARRLIMKRIWVVLLAILSMNTVLLSGCPIGPLPQQAEHRGDGAGGGGGGGGAGAGGAGVGHM